ncbi:MAG: hypothetical protein HOO67_02305 [Candidatus Peribacteraceae bacterium]|nr:hypothetical protein [Candidatus Peribacteraceae bacterium]
MKMLSNLDIVANSAAHGARQLADHYESLAENAAGKMKAHEINKKAKLSKKDLTNAAKEELLACCRRYNPTSDVDFVLYAKGAMEQKMRQTIYAKDRVGS